MAHGVHLGTTSSLPLFPLKAQLTNHQTSALLAHYDPSGPNQF